jgi:hypothetical protein
MTDNVYCSFGVGALKVFCVINNGYMLPVVVPGIGYSLDIFGVAVFFVAFAANDVFAGIKHELPLQKSELSAPTFYVVLLQVGYACEYFYFAGGKIGVVFE